MKAILGKGDGYIRLMRSHFPVMLLFLTLVFLTSSAYGAIITFEDGLTSSAQPGGTAVGSYYIDLGVQTPNLRFHHSTYSENVPFNFVDDWGAVVDYGVLGTSTGFIYFTSSIDYVEIDAMAQSAFDLNGSEPYSWSIAAFDVNNSQVAFASEMFGFDFSGTPNPPNTNPYPLASLSLRVEAIGAISRLEINSSRKFGIDTIRFEASNGAAPVPEPATMLLLVSGLVGLAGVRKRFRKQ